jgi:hypothetical protein
VKDVPVCLVWKGQCINFDDLRRGLEQTLNRIPLVAGRVNRGERTLQISNKASRGCLLKYERFADEMPGAEAGDGAWAKFGVAEPFIPSHYLEPFGRPLVSAKLVHFSDGCALYVNFSHTIFDADSCVKFLNVWSCETERWATESRGPTFPALDPGPINCDHVLSPHKDYTFTMKGSSRMRLTDAIQLMIALPIIDATDEIADFEISLRQWNTLRSSVLKQLEPGQWVSSYEAMMATIMNCIAKSDPSSKLFHGHVLTNLRGRSRLFANNYFGVAISTNVFSIRREELASSLAFTLHQLLQKGIQDVSAMEEIVMTGVHFDAAKTGRFGILQRVRNMGYWRKIFVERNRYLFNSWLGFNWLDVSFGCGAKADFLRVNPKFSARRLVFIFPRSADSIQLRIQLPRKQMPAFRKHLKEMFDF